jgi:hypothetical protein
VVAGGISGAVAGEPTRGAAAPELKIAPFFNLFLFFLFYSPSSIRFQTQNSQKQYQTT